MFTLRFIDGTFRIVPVGGANRLSALLVTANGNAKERGIDGA